MRLSWWEVVGGDLHSLLFKRSMKQEGWLFRLGDGYLGFVIQFLCVNNWHGKRNPTPSIYCSPRYPGAGVPPSFINWGSADLAKLNSSHLHRHSWWPLAKFCQCEIGKPRSLHSGVPLCSAPPVWAVTLNSHGCICTVPERDPEFWVTNSGFQSLLPCEPEQDTYLFNLFDFFDLIAE